MILKLKNIFSLLKSKHLPDLKNLILFFSLCLFLFSCSEDPFSPPPNNDPGIDTVAMYEWSWDTISGYLLDDIYVVDSNNIYMVGTLNSMMYYDGKTYTPIPYNDPTFSGKAISGYSQNNIFISGSRYVPPGPAKPCLKVWNGVSFLTYEFPNDTGNAIGEVMLTGYNQGWFSNLLHNIYYFDNGNLIQYYVNEIIGGGGFYRIQANDLYLFSSRIHGVFNPPYINTVYKFINDNFGIIHVDTSTTSTPMNNIYFPGSPYFFRGGHYTINLFTNGQWSQFCNTYNFEPYLVCAELLDSVFCFGAGISGTKPLFFWNGTKWVIESNFYYLRYGPIRIFPPSMESSQMLIVDRKIYLNFNNFDNYATYFLQGKPIQSKEGTK